MHSVDSPKTETATNKKRNHDHEYSHLSSSVLYSNKLTRLNVLMTTIIIINHNLAFRMVQYEEARLIQALLDKDEIKAKITTKQVKESIVELYFSTRRRSLSTFMRTARTIRTLRSWHIFGLAKKRRTIFLGCALTWWTKPGSTNKYFWE